jgi:hypothetical protein
MAVCRAIPPKNLSPGTNKTPPMPTLPMRIPTTNTTVVNSGVKNIIRHRSSCYEAKTIAQEIDTIYTLSDRVPND